MYVRACAVFFTFMAQAQARLAQEERARLAEETAERAKAEAEERARVAREAAKRAKVSDACVLCCTDASLQEREHSRARVGALDLSCVPARVMDSPHFVHTRSQDEAAAAEATRLAAEGGGALWGSLAT